MKSNNYYSHTQEIISYKTVSSSLYQNIKYVPVIMALSAWNVNFRGNWPEVITMHHTSEIDLLALKMCLIS